MESGQEVTSEAGPLISSMHGDGGRYSTMTFALIVSTIVAQCSPLATGCAVSFLTNVLNLSLLEFYGIMICA